MGFVQKDIEKLFKKAKVKASKSAISELGQLLEEITTDIVSEAYAVSRRAGKKKITKADIQIVRKELLG